MDKTYIVGIKNKTMLISKSLLIVDSQKIEVTNGLFLQVIFTSKNEKFFESSVSKVNFIFLSFEFM